MRFWYAGSFDPNSSTVSNEIVHLDISANPQALKSRYLSGSELSVTGNSWIAEICEMVEYLDNASGPTFDFPGLRTVLNDHPSVLSFSLNKRGLSIESRSDC